MIGGDVTKMSLDQSERRNKNLGPTKGSLSKVSVRQEFAPQHQRPSLGNLYSPSPAPGSTIHVVRKKILKQQKTQKDLAEMNNEQGPPLERMNTAGSNNVKFLDNDGEEYSRSSSTSLPPWLPTANVGMDHANSLKSLSSETPRALWRKQYWQKSTPWGTDRRVFGGSNL